MTYAMILKNEVIGLVDSDKEKPCWPNDLNGVPVIAVPCDNTVKLGMIYDSKMEVFSEYIAPQPQPTEGEILQAELLLNQVTILENQTAQDAVMAEILLGQLGV